MQTLDRSTEVLEAVIQAGGMSLADVQRRLGLGHTIAHRILQTWTELDYLAFDPQRKTYRAGIKLLSLGLRVRGAFVNHDLQQRLTRVADALDLTANVGLLFGRQIFYIARAESRYASSLRLEIGTTLPAHATAIGRVLLSYVAREHVIALYGDGPLPVYGPQTGGSVQHLATELEIIRRDGYAVCYQTIDEGLSSAAVPLRDAHGAVIAAMNIVGAIDRFDQQAIAERYLPVLRDATREPFALPPLFLGST